MVVAELLSAMSMPTLGAPVMVAVQLDVAPAVIVDGEHVRFDSAAAIPIIRVLTDLPFTLAAIFAAASVTTVPACTVNVLLSDPCLTTTLPGTDICG